MATIKEDRMMEGKSPIFKSYTDPVYQRYEILSLPKGRIKMIIPNKVVCFVT